MFKYVRFDIQICINMYVLNFRNLAPCGAENINPVLLTYHNSN